MDDLKNLTPSTKQLKEIVQQEELKTRLSKAVYENYYYRYMAMEYELKLREMEEKIAQLENANTTMLAETPNNLNT